MCSNEHLRHVTCGCIYVTYASRDRHPKSRKTQPCTRAASSIRRSARCRHTVGERFWRFSTPGVSLPPAGPAPQGTGACERFQSGFHRQALSRIGSTPSDIRQPRRLVLERSRKSSPARGLAAEKKAWLRGPRSIATQFNMNIGLIVCFCKNSSKLTNFSCPRSVEPSDVST